MLCFEILAPLFLLTRTVLIVSTIASLLRIGLFLFLIHMDTSQHCVWSILDRLMGTLPSNKVFALGVVVGRGMLVWPCLVI